MSNTIRASRWKLFGHTLRRDKSIPANKVMEFYFSKRSEKGFRGRRVTTLPITLVRDLDQVYSSATSLQDHQYYRRLKLNNEDDLETLRSLAEDRTAWRRLVEKIVEAGKATHSIEDDAEHQ